MNVAPVDTLARDGIDAGARRDICPVRSVDIRVGPGGWAYERARRPAIDAFFRAECAANPSLFNGPMLLAEHWEMRDGHLAATLCRTDFAAFLHWRQQIGDRRLDDLAGTRNLFGAAAVFSSDGRLLLGEMAAHTANAGMFYPPCGSLDPADADAGGRIDLEGAMLRELREETGLDPEPSAMATEATMLLDGPRLAILRALHLTETAEVLTRRIREHLAREAQPELSDIRFVAGIRDLGGAPVQPYVRAYLELLWPDGGRGAGAAL